MKKRIVVSGAGGFLGTLIVASALSLQEMDIVAVTSNVSKMKEAFKEVKAIIDTDEFLSNGFDFLPGDIFIHCLFPTNADGRKMANGLGKTFAVMDVAKKAGAGVFVNISSQSVYASNRELPAKEDDELSLETSYAVGKYCSEVYCSQVFHDRFYTNIRMASLLGVGYGQRIVNRMVDQALEGKDIHVIGGMQRYGFLDVRDAAFGVLKVVSKDPARWKSIYNLGRNESYTLTEIAALITERLREHGVVANYVVENGVDKRNSSINADRFVRDFIWEPQISLSQTIDDIIESKISRARAGIL